VIISNLLPYLYPKYEKMKNLDPLPTMEPKRKSIKLTFMIPADMQKILNGNGVNADVSIMEKV